MAWPLVDRPLWCWEVISAQSGGRVFRAENGLQNGVLDEPSFVEKEGAHSRSIALCGNKCPCVLVSSHRLRW